MGSVHSGQSPVADSHEHGNESLGSIYVADKRNV
jgi:hypothetical protein